MITPKTPKVDMEDTSSDWFEPFPEPQTIPSGWDVSDMVAASSPEFMESSPTTEE